MILPPDRSASQVLCSQSCNDRVHCAHQITRPVSPKEWASVLALVATQCMARMYSHLIETNDEYFVCLFVCSFEKEQILERPCYGCWGIPSCSVVVAVPFSPSRELSDTSFGCPSISSTNSASANRSLLFSQVLYTIPVSKLIFYKYNVSII